MNGEFVWFRKFSRGFIIEVVNEGWKMFVEGGNDMFNMLNVCGVEILMLLRLVVMSVE